MKSESAKLPQFIMNKMVQISSQNIKTFHSKTEMSSSWWRYRKVQGLIKIISIQGAGGSPGGARAIEAWSWLQQPEVWVWPAALCCVSSPLFLPNFPVSLSLALLSNKGFKKPPKNN